MNKETIKDYTIKGGGEILTALEWNIHQQGRRSKKIPLDIIDYIDGKDIIVLLEINTESENFNEFCNRLTLKGYSFYMTSYKDSPYANDILIAVKLKKNIYVKDVTYHKAYGNSLQIDYDCIPENLFVHLEINSKCYVVAGVRIKELKGDYAKRKEQMETFMNWVGCIEEPVFVLGDFNNLREKTTIKEWNLNVLDNIINEQFHRITPKENHSFGVCYDISEKKYDGYIKNDHLLVSSIVENWKTIKISYDWELLINNLGRVKVESKANKFGKQEIRIAPGFPDHARLIVEIPLF